MGPRGIVISPGPCTPNEAGISVEKCSGSADTLPILALLGTESRRAFGGKVVAPEIMHGKISQITRGQGIFAGLDNPSRPRCYHSARRARSLPAC